jgi:hypothetical protein
VPGGGGAGPLRLGLRGSPAWNFSVGVFVTKELLNIKSRRVAAATLRYRLPRAGLCVGAMRRVAPVCKEVVRIRRASEMQSPFRASTNPATDGPTDRIAARGTAGGDRQKTSCGGRRWKS